MVFEWVCKTKDPNPIPKYSNDTMDQESSYFKIRNAETEANSIKQKSSYL